MSLREWFVRTFHLGPDYDDIARGTELAECAYTQIQGMQEVKREFLGNFPISGFIRRESEDERTNTTKRDMGVSELPRAK